MRFASYIVHCVAPLAIGALFYIGFRNLDVPLFRWASGLYWIERVRATTLPLSSLLPAFVRGSFVDACSAYAFGAFFALTWSVGSMRRRVFWIALGGLVALGFEFLQIGGLVAGTFDPFDAIAIAVSYSFGVFLSMRIPRWVVLRVRVPSKT